MRKTTYLSILAAVIFLLSISCGALPLSADGNQTLPADTIPDQQEMLPSHTATAGAVLIINPVNPFLPTAVPTIDPHASQIDLDVTGEITATLNGDPYTWQSGAMAITEGIFHTSRWWKSPFSFGGDTFEVQLQGLHTPTASPPSPGQFNIQPGFQIVFTSMDVTPGSKLEFIISDNEEEEMVLDPSEADIFFVPAGDEENQVYQMTDGRLNITVLQAAPGEPAAFEGTFSGTLTYRGNILDHQSELDPERTLELKEGYFHIEQVMYDEERSEPANINIPIPGLQ